MFCGTKQIMMISKEANEIMCALIGLGSFMLLVFGIIYSFFKKE